MVQKRLTALARGIPALELGIVRGETLPSPAKLEERETRKRSWIAEKRGLMERRDLSGRANGTIDPFYGYFLPEEVQDYALNFSLPWRK
jgi:carboxypeptidase D